MANSANSYEICTLAVASTLAVLGHLVTRAVPRRVLSAALSGLGERASVVLGDTAEASLQARACPHPPSCLCTLHLRSHMLAPLSSLALFLLFPCSAFSVMISFHVVSD